MRYFVHTDHWYFGGIGYEAIYTQSLIPNPHISGYWSDGFDFTNDYFLLLGIL